MHIAFGNLPFCGSPLGRLEHFAVRQFTGLSHNAQALSGSNPSIFTPHNAKTGTH